MPMLNGIHLVDFGNHRSTRLTFGRMTALVGQNGSGKTNVMRALQAVALKMKFSADYSEDDVRPGADVASLLVAWSPSKEKGSEWGLCVCDDSWWIKHSPSQAAAGIWLPEPGAKEVADPTKEGFPIISSFEELSYVQLKPGESRSAPFLRGRHTPVQWSCRYFKTNARALQRASFPGRTRPSLDEEGGNLAWVLSYLMTSDPDRFARIMDGVRQVIPVLRRVRAQPVQLTRTQKKTITINKQERSFDEEQTVMGQELIFDMASGSGLPASAVSEGTLVVLAVLTLIHSQPSVDLVMLDDIELGLHPRAQRDLVQQLRRIQETHPDLQLLISTHSPYVVDELSPEEVWLLRADAQGIAAAKRLSDHPDAKRALEVLTTGEFWSAEGEDWVEDAPPAARVAETPGPV